ncbi:hypothetical protein, partial [Gottschalkia purinilytica]|uniref:hypothetical protein n=1 Tax=Gottschalkia purinilytica TaxID=1503 RepID=UPI001F1C7518
FHSRKEKINMIRFKNLRCNECGELFRITSRSGNVEHALCPNCGDDEVDYMTDRQEEIFEDLI